MRLGPIARNVIFSIIAMLILFVAAVFLLTDLRQQLRDAPFLNHVNQPWVRKLEATLYHLRYSPIGPSQLGEGKSALEIHLSEPAGIAYDDSVNMVYLSDRGHECCGRVIWRIDELGIATIFAGTGRRGLSRTEIDARLSNLGSPQGLAIDRSGDVYFADSYNHVILRVGRNGILTRVAGSGRPGFSGDGGDALMATLDQPYDVSLDSNGNLYIADFGNHRIRRVTRDGKIFTIAGTGEPLYTGDGGPASLAALNGPYGVLAVDDEVLIADSFNHVVRRVDRNGVIETIAGVGKRGYSGDGGPPTLAELNTPEGLFVDKLGRLFIGDEHNDSVRLIVDNRIQTVIGTGSPGCAEDGELYQGAALHDPEELLVLNDGSILLVDGQNLRVIRLGEDGLLHRYAGSGHRAGESNLACARY
jgi:DNA-binding beta-propeller fold protein YncE